MYLDNFKSWYNVIVNDLFEYLEISEGIWVDSYVEDVVTRLKDRFNGIYFVSDCFLPSEIIFKNKLSEYFGIRLIKTYGNKSLVNMGGGIFVDDRIKNLLGTNAKYKICKYTPFNYEKSGGVVVGKNWLLIGSLLGVFGNDNVGAGIC